MYMCVCVCIHMYIYMCVWGGGSLMPHVYMLTISMCVYGAEYVHTQTPPPPPPQVIPIINIPEYGNLSAQYACEQLKVQSQNDAVKLAEAKNMVYLKGFTDGVMEVGPYAGRKVWECWVCSVGCGSGCGSVCSV